MPVSRSNSSESVSARAAAIHLDTDVQSHLIYWQEGSGTKEWPKAGGGHAFSSMCDVEAAQALYSNCGVS